MRRLMALFFALGPRRTAGALMALMMVLLLPAGCAKEPPTEEMLKTAWEFTETRDFDKAMELARAYLSAHPGSSVGHYVFGKCWLHRPQANTSIAKGEFETALRLLADGEDTGFLEEKMGRPAFEAAIHRDIGLALMRAIYDSLGQGLPPQTVLPVMRLALEHVDKGLALEPESSYLKEMRDTLIRMVPTGPPPAPVTRLTI